MISMSEWLVLEICMKYVWLLSLLVLMTNISQHSLFEPFSSTVSPLHTQTCGKRCGTKNIKKKRGASQTDAWNHSIRWRKNGRGKRHSAIILSADRLWWRLTWYLLWRLASHSKTLRWFTPFSSLFSSRTKTTLGTTRMAKSYLLVLRDSLALVSTDQSGTRFEVNRRMKTPSLVHPTHIHTLSIHPNLNSMVDSNKYSKPHTLAATA